MYVCHPMNVRNFYEHQLIATEVFGLEWREYEDFWGPRRTVDGYGTSSGYEVIIFSDTPFEGGFLTSVPYTDTTISNESADKILKRFIDDWRYNVKYNKDGSTSIKRKWWVRAIDRIRRLLPMSQTSL